MLVVLAERARQGRFMLVFILALDLSVCLLITQCSLQWVDFSQSATGWVVLTDFAVELLHIKVIGG